MAAPLDYWLSTWGFQAEKSLTKTVFRGQWESMPIFAQRENVQPWTFDTLFEPSMDILAPEGIFLGGTLQLPPDAPPLWAAQVRTMLAPSLFEALAPLYYAGWTVSVRNTGLRAVSVGPFAEPDVFQHLLSTLVRATRHLHECRKRLPVDPRVEAYVRYAASQNLESGIELLCAPICVQGMVPEGRLYVGLVAAGGHWMLQGGLRTETRFEGDLTLLPGRDRNRLSRWVDRVSGSDVELGEPEFDAAFVVQGSSPEVLRGVLTEPLRKTLLAASARFPTLQLRGLSLTIEPVELGAQGPEIFYQAVEALLRVMRALRPAILPYR